jgi:hypothetical protein
MKLIIVITCCFFLQVTLSSCEKDCKGSYTIEGTIWNGTKGKPRTGILVKAVAGKGNSLFSGGSNVRDVGNARTDENGYFKISYNCIGDDMTGISLSSPDLSYSGISNQNRLPINQNFTGSYNIPDSVTINIYIEPKSPLLTSDTAYIHIPGATESFDNQSYYARFYRVTPSSSIKSGLFKTVRIKYKDQEYPIDNKLFFRSARGYSSYLNVIKNNPEFSILLTKMEPEKNEITIYY